MQTVRIGKKHIRVIALCLLAILILLTVIKAPAIKRQLNAWKLLPQPERLSELYYKDHAKLPTNYTPGTVQRYSFITHNLEYRATAYSYNIVAQSEDGTQKQQLASGSFSLPQDSFNTSQIDFTPQDLGRRVEIITTLTIQGVQNSTQAESIHYWVTKTGEGV